MDKIKAIIDFVKNTILYVLAYIAKNAALIIGIVESLAKAIAGIINLFTPAKSKDKLVALVDKIASAIKKVLYDISDKFAGVTI